MGERFPTQRIRTVGETLNARRESLDSKGVKHYGESTASIFVCKKLETGEAKWEAGCWDH